MTLILKLETPEDLVSKISKNAVLTCYRAEICQTTLLSYSLIPLMEVELKNVSLSGNRNFRAVYSHIRDMVS